MLVVIGKLKSPIVDSELARVDDEGPPALELGTLLGVNKGLPTVELPLLVRAEEFAIV